MKRIFYKLLKTVFSYRNWLLLAAFLGFLTVGSGIGLLMTSAYVISKAALHPSIVELQVAIVGVRFFGISRGVFRYLERMVSHDLTFKLLAGFRVWFFNAIIPLAPARLMRYRSADLLTRLVNDVDSLQHIFIRVIYPPMVALLIIMLMWWLLGIFNPLFGITILISLLISGCIIPVISLLLSRKPNERLIQLRAELNECVLDGIQGLPELLVNNQTGTCMGQLRQINDAYNRQKKQLAIISGFHESFIGLLLNLTIAILFFQAVPLIDLGWVEGLYLAVIILGVMASFEVILPMPSAFLHLRESTRAGERLYDILEAGPKISGNGVRQEKVPENFDIRIHNLDFAYQENEPPVFKDFSLELPFGKKLAVVGASGSGKSTIANLMLGFWQQYQGSITLGNREIKTYRQEELLNYFSYVSQSSHIFNETIRHNLLLAPPGAGEKTLWRALDFAGLKSFVHTLPNQLDTEVGSFGKELSGGEAQRLSLAQGYLKTAPVLILDEATSRLDLETEQRILNRIWGESTERTVLIFTHRFSGLENLDEIIVLDSGQIAEAGNFVTLLEKRGYFYHTWLEQNEKRVLEQLK